jgi:Holliday junction resolvasome RuvABC ATP-dependent DNA helicase subunit|tara:strand:- start:723 stop:1646 length:924 start_codon:yes stop_codon:yes gene_type:complete
MNAFNNLIGQERLKKKLNFYLSAAKHSDHSPFLCLTGAKGLGKTEFAKEFALELKKIKAREGWCEVNCSILKGNSYFFEEFYPQVIQDKNVVVFFDEAHNLPKDLEQAFLTIFNSDQDTLKEFQWDNRIYPFDFTRQTFIFATTESDRIFPPLQDRFTMVDFEPYSPSELGEILKSRAKGINFTGNTLTKLQDIVRNNARSAVMRAREIQLYCESRNQNTFGEQDYDELCDQLGILARGITSTEKQILEILNDLGECSLTMLAARTGLSPSSVRKHHETYLLRRGLMHIDGKRKLTQQGKELIHEIQ